MSIFSQPLKEQRYALVFLADILLLSNSKLHMLEPIGELH